jgi:DNA-binding transcriptional MerR regulator
MTNRDDEELLTPAEVARMAQPQVTPQAVRLWADSGRLPVLRTPAGLRLFRRADVLHHLADRQALGRSAGRRRG